MSKTMTREQRATLAAGMVRPANMTERSGWIANGWRTTPRAKKKAKVRAGWRGARESHRHGACIVARGEAGLDLLDMLNSLSV